MVKDVLAHVAVRRGDTVQLLGYSAAGIIQAIIRHKTAVGPGDTIGSIQIRIPRTVPDHVGRIGSHVGTHEAVIAHRIEPVTLGGGVVVRDGHPQGAVAHQGGQVGIAAGAVGQLVGVVGALAPKHTVLIQIDRLAVAAKDVDVVIVSGGIDAGTAGRTGQLGLAVLGLHGHIGIFLVQDGSTKAQLAPVIQTPGIGPVVPGPGIGAV